MATKVAVTRMTGADVLRISLVPRGANRIPFRVMKEEIGMATKIGEKASLDLAGFGRALKREPTPAIVAVIAMKSEITDSMVESIKAAGFDITQKHEYEDGSVAFFQVENGTEVVQKSEGDLPVLNMGAVSIVCKGFSPYSMDTTGPDAASFSDQVAAQGFYPCISSVMDTLSSAVRSAAYNAASPTDAATAAAKVMSEATTYIRSLMAALPSKAFKLEEITVEKQEATSSPVTSPVTDTAPVVVGKAACAEPDDDDDNMTPDQKAKMKAKEKAKAPVAKAEGEDDTTDKETPVVLTLESVSSIVAESVSGALAALVAKMDSMAKASEESAATISGLASKIEEVEKTAKKASETISTVVLGSGGEDDGATRQRAEKGDDAENWSMDTAYSKAR